VTGPAFGCWWTDQARVRVTVTYSYNGGRVGNVPGLMMSP